MDDCDFFEIDIGLGTRNNRLYFRRTDSYSDLDPDQFSHFPALRDRRS